MIIPTQSPIQIFTFWSTFCTCFVFFVCLFVCFCFFLHWCCIWIFRALCLYRCSTYKVGSFHSCSLMFSSHLEALKSVSNKSRRKYSWQEFCLSTCVFLTVHLQVLQLKVILTVCNIALDPFECESLLYFYTFLTLTFPVT